MDDVTGFNENLFGPIEDPEPTRILYRLSGGLADSGVVDAAGLARSLDGLQQLLYVCERLFILQKATSTVRLPTRHAIFLSPPRKGSWEQDLLWLMGVYVPLIYGEQIRDMDARAKRAIWEQIVEIKNFVIAHKVAARDSADLAKLVASHFLAEARGLIYDSVDLVSTVRLLLESLLFLTEPLEDSASNLDLECELGEPMQFNQDDRYSLALPLPDADDEQVTDEYETPIFFVRLNNKTGRGLINLLESPGHQRHCEVVDPKFLLSRNQYDLAYADRVWIVATVQEMKPSGSRRQTYFRILETSGERYVGETLLPED